MSESDNLDEDLNIDERFNDDDWYVGKNLNEQQY